MQKIIAVDSEGTGLSHIKDSIFAVSFTSYEGEDRYFRFKVDPFTRKVTYDTQLEEIREILSHEDWLYVFHNSIYDLAMFRSLGIVVRGFVADTLLIADCIDNSRNSYGLKPLTSALFNDSNDDEAELHEAVKKARREGKKLGYKIAEDLKADFWLAPDSVCGKYATADTRRAIKLFKYYQAMLKQEHNKFSILHKVNDIVALEHSLIYPVLDMSTKGVCINYKKLDELEAYYRTITDKCKQEVVELGYPELNPRSATQKAAVFYDELAMTAALRRRKGKDGVSTKTRTVDKKTLASWASNSPLASTLLKMSEAEKQLSGFIIPFREMAIDEGNGLGRIYPGFSISGAHRSGRMSSHSPNLQNITTSTSPMKLTDIEFRLREVFVPKPGTAWVLADYSQVETVLTAYLSKDSLLMDIIETGKSQHDCTRDSIFSKRTDFSDPERYKTYRKLSKILNFSLPYGVGIAQLAEHIGVSYAESSEIWHGYWNTYSGVKRYRDMLAKLAKDNGYIMDLFGRTYRPQAGQEYKALNYMIQGLAAGIFKRAFKAVSSLLETRYSSARVCLVVHDEIIVESPVELLGEGLYNDIRLAMQQEFHKLLGKPTPLGVSVSLARDNWGVKEECQLS